MKPLEGWLDSVVQRCAEWLADIFPGSHALATVGNKIAGVRARPSLPIDRRLGLQVSHMVHHNRTEKATAPAKQMKGETNRPGSCNFWAYCYMSGQPCVWCGGWNMVDKNSIDYGGHEESEARKKAFCPNGSKPGSMWYGCCKDNWGRARMIAFLDCCYPTGESHWCKWWLPCNAWDEAKNWCNMGGYQSYYCTLAVNFRRSDPQCE